MPSKQLARQVLPRFPYRAIAKSLSLPVILTLSLPKGKNPTLSAETLRFAQGDMKVTLQSSCGFRRDLIFADDASGMSFKHSDWE